MAEQDPPVTHRKAAAKHLPELDQSYDELAARFNAKLTWLQTPDLTAGRKPNWLDMAVKVSKPSMEPRPRVNRGRR